MINLCTLLKLKRQIRILEHANSDLESALALQKEYNGSNLRRIDSLEPENTELVRKLMDKGHFIFLLFLRDKHIWQTYLSLSLKQESQLSLTILRFQYLMILWQKDLSEKTEKTITLLYMS